MACRVVDRAIQLFGAAGLSQDTPLSALFARLRTLRIVDGPDEVHLRVIAKYELKKYAHAENTKQ
jgi:acyl-CoA dehydrogenase